MFSKHAMLTLVHRSRSNFGHATTTSSINSFCNSNFSRAFSALAGQSGGGLGSSTLSESGRGGVIVGDGGQFRSPCPRMQGIRFHSGAKSFYDGSKNIDYPINSPEFQQLMAFEEQEKLKKHEVSTEYQVQSKEHGNGIVDLLVKHEDGTYTIIDWKLSSSHNIEKNMPKYVEQVNKYRNILEEKGKTIKGMFIAGFHPTMSTFVVWEVTPSGLSTRVELPAVL